MKDRRLPPSDADLTAKARIRNAAFELYASKGEASTTLREVAGRAGVTHGLVVHHFGNKEGLRRAVQERVVELLQGALTAVPNKGSAAEIGRARDASVAAMYAEHPAYPQYLRRDIVDLDSADPELLKLLADVTLTQVRELRASGVSKSSEPEHRQALAIIMRELGALVLEPAARRLWSILTGGGGGPPPELEIRLRKQQG